jgi:hypothetical protein
MGHSVSSKQQARSQKFQPCARDMGKDSLVSREYNDWESRYWFENINERPQSIFILCYNLIRLAELPLHDAAYELDVGKFNELYKSTFTTPWEKCSSVINYSTALVFTSLPRINSTGLVLTGKILNTGVGLNQGYLIHGERNAIITMAPPVMRLLLKEWRSPLIPDLLVDKWRMRQYPCLRHRHLCSMWPCLGSLEPIESVQGELGSINSRKCSIRWNYRPYLLQGSRYAIPQYLRWTPC